METKKTELYALNKFIYKLQVFKHKGSKTCSYLSKRIKNFVIDSHYVSFN